MKFIPLTQNQQTIVDDDLCDFLKKFKWYAVKAWGSNFYARHTMTFRVNSKRHQQVVWLHHLIVGQPRMKRYITVDHINGNGLDNRRMNLRVVSHRENCLNRRSSFEKESKYPGVFFDSDRKMWQSRISIGKKRIFLGRYENENDAYAAYKKESDRLLV